VTLGKGIGNGFPMGAAVATRDVAEKFANGMEYFNSNGGCNAACVAGSAVLDVIREQGLQSNAERIGRYLLRELEQLATRTSVVGDVRGRGLFIGVEIVMSQASKVPAPHVADWVVMACMSSCRVLLSTDGPCGNVIKIKPPLCFSMENADSLLEALGEVLLEDLPERLPQLLHHDAEAAVARDKLGKIRALLPDREPLSAGGTAAVLSGRSREELPGGATDAGGVAGVTAGGRSRGCRSARILRSLAGHALSAALGALLSSKLRGGWRGLRGGAWNCRWLAKLWTPLTDHSSARVSSEG